MTSAISNNPRYVIRDLGHRKMSSLSEVTQLIFEREEPRSEARKTGSRALTSTHMCLSGGEKNSVKEIHVWLFKIPCLLVLTAWWNTAHCFIWYITSATPSCSHTPQILRLYRRHNPRDFHELQIDVWMFTQTGLRTELSHQLWEDHE